MRKSLKAKLQNFTKSQLKAQKAAKYQEHRRNIGVKTKSTQKKPHVKLTIPYAKCDSVLLVGEANFSFAAALTRLFSVEISEEERAILRGIKEEKEDELNIVATTLDSEAITNEKYPDAVGNVGYLRSRNISVQFDRDATRIPRSVSDKAPFDKMVFNFPHVGLGIKDKDRNIVENQKLILGFFKCALSYLKPETGEIHITLKGGMPYDMWQVKRLARLAGLICQTSFAFDPKAYPGYAHRRTLGFQDALSKLENEELLGKDCRTFILTRSSDGPPPKVKRQRHQNDDDDSSDSDE
jgi:25S rRNA (uracil2634-N3)-methyltransferase